VKFNTMKGAALGASFVYFFDPARGRARRAVLSGRVVSLSRVALGSRPRRKPKMSETPPGWEYPMTIVHIDVDDRFALPDLGLQTARRRKRGIPRSFTRLPRGASWAFPGTSATRPH
jgi:hypothetical protein